MIPVEVTLQWDWEYHKQ